MYCHPIPEPLSAKISAKISSFLSVSIMIACPVRPTVPLDQCTAYWLEKDAISQAWRVGIAAVLDNAFCMDVYQLRAPSKINL